MKCLRCGYCCKHLWVVIVNDPKIGLRIGNLTTHNGKGVPCKHLRGDKPGEYWCAIHDLPWYKETPCYSHGQIERSPDDLCRMGEYLLREEKANGRKESGKGRRN